jgi:hypothetical protein
MMGRMDAEALLAGFDPETFLPQQWQALAGTAEVAARLPGKSVEAASGIAETEGRLVRVIDLDNQPAGPHALTLSLQCLRILAWVRGGVVERVTIG